MFLVVAYDIADDRRRVRVMKLLKGYGEHIQESVFECDLDAARTRRLVRALRALIDPQADNVRLYALCRQDVARIGQLGVPRPVQLARELIIV